VLTQTRRHTYIVTLLGLKHLVLAVNKMDLVGYDEAAFRAIEAEYRAFARSLGASDVTCIPVSALKGDNIIEASAAMPWYRGPVLLDHLERVDVSNDLAGGAFRMPVQLATRPDQSFRGVSGLVVSGAVRPGDRVKIMPSARETAVARIVTYDGDLAEAAAGQSVTLTFADEVDASRGSVVCAAKEPLAVADQFEVQVLWMGDEPMLPGRPYLIKAGTRTVGGALAQPKYKVNVNTLEHAATRTLELNEIGVCNMSLDAEIAFAPYAENRDLGGFIVIDRFTNNTVGMGLVHFALRRASNIHWQAMDVTREARAGLARQQPCMLWFTGLSGAGKSTIANLVEKRLHALGRMTYLLDGDNVRHGLNRDLGFTDADRVENIRRVAEVARLMVDAGLIVLVSFISPFRSERLMARELVRPGEFVEVFVDTPLSLAESRDPKGLYAKARRGEIANFTGISSPYEPPESPEIRIDTAARTAEDAAMDIVAWLERAGRLG
jgi:bifunctional enzyme CysN/CysC